MLTATQRNFMTDCLDGQKIKRTRNKSMIRKRLRKKYALIEELAKKFIEDFYLLSKYLENDKWNRSSAKSRSSKTKIDPAMILLSLLVRKHGKDKISDMLTEI